MVEVRDSREHLAGNSNLRNVSSTRPMLSSIAASIAANVRRFSSLMESNRFE